MQVALQARERPHAVCSLPWAQGGALSQQALLHVCHERRRPQSLWELYRRGVGPQLLLRRRLRGRYEGGTRHGSGAS